MRVVAPNCAALVPLRWTSPAPAPSAACALPQLRRSGGVVALFGNKEPSDAESKRLEAEKLALKAEIAELQATELALKARSLAPDEPGEAPPATPPPVPPTVAPSPSPVAAGGESLALAELCIALDRSAQQAGLESSEALQRSVASAWQAARATQRGEVERLRKRLASAAELKAASDASSEGSFMEGVGAGTLYFEELEREMSSRLDFGGLWEMAENRTGSTVERRARARAVTRASFKLLAPLTTYKEEEEEVPVPGQGVVRPTSDRERLRLLERHEAADCVEYRLFGAALAEDDSLEEAALASILVDEDLAVGNVTSFIFRWFSDTIQEQELSEEEEMELRNALEVDDLEELTQSKLAPWLEPLAELLGRSTTVPSGVIFDLSDPESSGIKLTLFPMMLALVAVRQGNFEPLVVYYFSRLLARANMQALARYEARDAPMSPDTLVAEQEGSFIRKTVEDALASLGLAFFLSNLLFWGLAIYLSWQAFNAVGGYFAPPPYDPLNF